VAFLFDHEIDHDASPESEKYDPWYFHVEVEFDAERIGAYYGQKRVRGDKSRFGLEGRTLLR